jgi:hypothetical protein
MGIAKEDHVAEDEAAVQTVALELVFVASCIDAHERYKVE